MERDPRRKAAGSIGDTLARLLELPYRANVSAGTSRTGSGPADALKREKTECERWVQLIH
jgi:hypothetical protein